MTGVCVELTVVCASSRYRHSKGRPARAARTPRFAEAGVTPRRAMMAHMRVLHVETGRHLYGGAEQVRYLVGELARGGIENALVCAAGSPLAARVAPAEVIELPVAGDADLRIWWRLRRLIEAYAPDLVHVHSRRGADLYGGLAARSRGIPAVLTRRVESAEPAMLLRFKCRPYRCVIAVSQCIEHDLVSRVGLAPARVRLIPSVVDTQVFRPGAHATPIRALFGLPADCFVVGVVAQLIPRKGHSILLRAVAELVPTCANLAVLCLGRGPLLARLRAEAALLGIDAHVHFAGHRDDVPALLPQFDLLVHPALREGLGVALLEAQSAGVPILASAVGGIPELIAHGRSGWLVAPGDPRALAEAIALLVHAPGLRRVLAAEARAQVEHGHALHELAARHLSVYEAAVSG
jgi:glycosyltransferase involved in cell wall biosynthesis